MRPAASWGHRNSNLPGPKGEMFFGYYLPAAVMVAALPLRKPKGGQNGGQAIASVNGALANRILARDRPADVRLIQDRLAAERQRHHVAGRRTARVAGTGMLSASDNAIVAHGADCRIADKGAFRAVLAIRCGDFP
jgi:hypothetical protein